MTASSIRPVCSACGTQEDWRDLGREHLQHYTRGAAYPLGNLTPTQMAILSSAPVCPGKPVLSHRVMRLTVRSDGTCEVTE
jgi:hypothetical protein